MNIFLFLYFWIHINLTTSFDNCAIHPYWQQPIWKSFAISCTFSKKTHFRQIIDVFHGFTLLYPKDLLPHVWISESNTSRQDFTFSEPDLFYILYISIEKTSFTSPAEWVKATNKPLPQEGKIHITRQEIRDGIIFLHLDAPLIVDRDGDKLIYQNRKQLIVIKDGELYTLGLRDGLDKSPYGRDFDRMAESFKFLK